MAQTYLQLVNTLLRRVREDQVSTVSDSDYSLLLGEYINLAKDELETMHDWARLRWTTRIYTSPGVFAYEVEDFKHNYVIEKVFNDTLDGELHYREYKQMSCWLNANNADDQRAPPAYYDINGYTADDDPVINLFPIPDAKYYINIDATVAQVPLSADADEVIIPHQPIVERALVHVLEERGEDDGERYMRQVMRAEEYARRYQLLDIQKWPEKYVWTVK